jgi:hypothetical protein
VGFVVLVLWGMERLTISSTVPRLADLPGLTPPEIATLEAAGVRSTRRLAGEDPARLAQRTSLDPARAVAAVGAARLTTLRGLGARNAETLYRLGIRDPCELPGRDPMVLVAALRERGSRRPSAAEVRVWRAAATRECAAGDR